MTELISRTLRKLPERRLPNTNCPTKAPAMREDPNDWWSRASCLEIGGDAFFPGDSELNSKAAKLAKQICQRCEIKGKCLDYAITHDEQDGIWGGLSRKEREQLQTEPNTN